MSVSDRELQRYVVMVEIDLMRMGLGRMGRKVGERARLRLIVLQVGGLGLGPPSYVKAGRAESPLRDMLAQNVG